jgi:hypothetical protein
MTALKGGRRMIGKGFTHGSKSLKIFGAPHGMFIGFKSN